MHNDIDFQIAVVLFTTWRCLGTEYYWVEEEDQDEPNRSFEASRREAHYQKVWSSIRKLDEVWYFFLCVCALAASLQPSSTFSRHNSAPNGHYTSFFPKKSKKGAYFIQGKEHTGLKLGRNNAVVAFKVDVFVYFLFPMWNRKLLLFMVLLSTWVENCRSAIDEL